MRKHIRTIFRLRFTTVGLFIAIPFGLFSFTPSLLPRVWFFQAVLTGILLAFGYGLGNALGALYRYFELHEPGRTTKIILKRTGIVTAIMVGLSLISLHITWNNYLLELTSQTADTGFYVVQILLLASIIAYVLIVLSRSLRLFVRASKILTLKILPIRLAYVLGTTIGIYLLFIIFNGILLQYVMNGVNSAFSLRDSQTDPGITQPLSPLRSGSPDSLVQWDTLGRQGRNFTSGGPTVAEITAITQSTAVEPIRVYVGLKTADTLQERAELALKELQRTGAFDRKILIVATTTGTGWLDPGAVDTVEYLHNGDTAIVGLQYSYLPSWISLFVDQQITKDTAHATLLAVHDYWTSLPADDRPELYLFGLSLGAYGSIDSSTNLRLVSDPVDGALWVGTPFLTESWRSLTDSRDVGSPAWRPIVDEGRVVRFTGAADELHIPSAEWGDVKYAFLQHASDPIVFFSPDLLYKEPDWLQPDQRGPDVSEDMRWVPGVTFWQVAADLPAAGAVPNGHGHAYSPLSYINAWEAITDPQDISDASIMRLESLYK